MREGRIIVDGEDQPVDRLVGGPVHVDGWLATVNPLGDLVTKAVRKVVLVRKDGLGSRVHVLAYRVSSCHPVENMANLDI